MRSCEYDDRGVVPVVFPIRHRSDDSIRERLEIPVSVLGDQGGERIVVDLVVDAIRREQDQRCVDLDLVHGRHRRVRERCLDPVVVLGGQLPRCAVAA